jgi:hypothetical protein
MVYEFRTLRADEIECRVGTVTDKGVSLLMYKDARVDMRLLDEVVGAENWQRKHELIDGQLFCTVSIRNENGEWVGKQDVGTESNTEKEKGRASDAFKRACFNWGVGRELYSCPFVWVNLNPNEWKANAYGKSQPRVKFHVSDIAYDDNRNVSRLVIKDDKGSVRFTFGAGAAQQPQPQQQAAQQTQQQAPPHQAQKAQPNADYDTLKKVLSQVDKAKTRQELIAIYNANLHLGGCKQFIDACVAKQAELKEQK